MRTSRFTLAFTTALLFALSQSFAQTDTIAKPAITCPGRQLPYPRQEPDYNNKDRRDLAAFTSALAKIQPRLQELEGLVKGKSVTAIQSALQDGKLSSVELVLYYLDRIRRYDIGLLNSVLEINPDLLKIARAKDKQRRRKKSAGPLHGIPVLLKDNIATADKLHSSAGTWALQSWKPSEDAFLVAQLRKSGAIIMGKANMSEWANYMDPCMPSGFSVRGGQTRNPYGPFDTWGSSSGSAVAVAADLVTISVGSETQGSIIMPARINSVVGLKPSMGLLSRSGIIPLLEYQDVPGPFGKTVADVAALLSGMTGTDPRDTATAAGKSAHALDYTKYLDSAAWKNIRIGVPLLEEADIAALLANYQGSTPNKAGFQNNLETNRKIQLKAIEAFRAAGMEVVMVPNKEIPARLTDIGQALQFGFKQDLNQFLSSLGTRAPFPSLEAIIAHNKEDLKNRAPFGQGLLEGSQHTKLTKEAFEEMKKRNIEKGRNGIDSLLSRYNIDVLVSDVNQTYAPAGYPALTIPAGYSERGEPQAIILVGTRFSEPALIAAGAAFEEKTKAWKAPDLERTLAEIRKISATPFNSRK
ncbi:amidase family protein [Flavihumibacter stibioxidans]|uniref:amidase family protein n=1 Tax=Flavihumibacter stibioxidans TaxID=1834163 RepID=UPI00164F4BA0|nr:amidase family protein [Flavihumibacter stibioxidans]